MELEDTSGLPTTSPSQVETYDLCARKWGFDKLDGIKAPQAPSAALGERVHTELERYFLTGHKPTGATPESALALVTVPHWPDPNKVTVSSEAEARFTWGGIGYSGRKDAGWVDEAGRVWIGDLKTTSDFKYAKGPEVLAHDPQGIFYAMYALVTSKDDGSVQRDGVNLRWVYSRTRGALKTLVTEVHIPGEEIVSRFESAIVPTTRLLRKARLDYPRVEGVLQANNLPPNLEACSAYGGCYYRGKFCKLDVKTAMAQLKGEMKMVDFKAKLAAAKAAQQGEAAKAQAVVPIATEEVAEAKVNPPAPPPTPAGGLLAKLKAASSGATPAQVAPVAPAPPPTPATPKECACGEPVTPGKNQCADCEAASRVVGIVQDVKPDVVSIVLPPPKAAPVVVTPAVTAENKKTILTQPLDNPTVVQSPAKAPSVTLPPVPVDISCQPTQTRQTHGQRAYAAYLEERQGLTFDGKPAPTWEALPEGIRKAWERSTHPARNAPVLCVGCFPSQAFDDFGAQAHSIHDEMCRETGVVDFRLIEYGKGPGALLAFAKDWASKRPNFFTGYWYADPRDPVVSCILPAVVPLFDSVIRAGA